MTILSLLVKMLLLGVSSRKTKYLRQWLHAIQLIPPSKPILYLKICFKSWCGLATKYLTRRKHVFFISSLFYVCCNRLPLSVFPYNLEIFLVSSFPVKKNAADAHKLTKPYQTFLDFRASKSIVRLFLTTWNISTSIEGRPNDWSDL